MAKTEGFFEKPKAHSLVKIDIAAEYFATWSQIMKGTCQTLTYLDLCSGPGRYEDGTAATPLRVLDEVEKNISLHSRIRLFFYEQKKKYCDELEENIFSHPVVSRLRHAPEIQCMEIDHSAVANLPIDDCTFTFIDPWGYKEITLDLLSAVLKDFGNDCLFYLSTEGIGRSLNIPGQEHNLLRLLGADGLKNVRKHRANPSDGRPIHKVIVDTLGISLRNKGSGRKNYFVPFAIESDSQHRVQHYLGFISKHPLAFRKMKIIMAKHSHKDSKGVPTFHFTGDTQLSFPAFETALGDLSERVYQKFRGQTKRVGTLVDECHLEGYLCLDRNIKNALEILLVDGRLRIVSQMKTKRREGTFSDKLTVEFT